MSMATMRFTVRAGALVRGYVKREIGDYAHNNDITCQIDEDKGWFVSSLRFTVSGETDKLKRMQDSIKQWCKDN